VEFDAKFHAITLTTTAPRPHRGNGSPVARNAIHGSGGPPAGSEVPARIRPSLQKYAHVAISPEPENTTGMVVTAAGLPDCIPHGARVWAACRRLLASQALDAVPGGSESVCRLPPASDSGSAVRWSARSLVCSPAPDRRLQRSVLGYAPTGETPLFVLPLPTRISLQDCPASRERTDERGSPPRGLLTFASSRSAVPLRTQKKIAGRA